MDARPFMSLSFSAFAAGKQEKISKSTETSFIVAAFAVVIVLCDGCEARY
jgi:hypothetical protein